MKSIHVSKRTKALLSIGIVALCNGAISKKVIRYAAGGCIKEAQEITFDKVKNNYFI